MIVTISIDETKKYRIKSMNRRKYDPISPGATIEYANASKNIGPVCGNGLNKTLQFINKVENHSIHKTYLFVCSCFLTTGLKNNVLIVLLC